MRVILIDNLISSLTDLLTAYINDKNSSSLREFITVVISGYQHNPKKLGYNGFKQNSTIGGKSIACEARLLKSHRKLTRQTW
jgi:hypothetical protein